MLTTEHYNLAMLRIVTINEANGRASVFISALSAGLIALGFQGLGHGGDAALSSLAFLGLVAFLRCVEMSIDDWEFGVRVGRLRRLRRADARTCRRPRDDLLGEESAAMLSSRWQPFQKLLSVAGRVGALAGVVFGPASACWRTGWVPLYTRRSGRARARAP